MLLRLEPQPVVRGAGEVDDVALLEIGRQVDAALGGNLLEERVGVMPGSEVGLGAFEAAGKGCVEPGFPACERLGGCPVALVERGEQPLLVHLGRGDREREPVAVAERPGGFVA